MAQLPVDRGKPGSKLHLIVDGRGLPLVPAVTAANINDGVLLAAMVDDLPKVATPAGRRRSRPGKLHTDKAYDSKDNRAYLRHHGIIPRLARRGWSRRPPLAGIAGSSSGHCRG